MVYICEYKHVHSLMQHTENAIKSRIFGKGRGWVFTPSDFNGLGSSSSIRKALSTLTQKGLIRRLTTGIYDYPLEHLELGVLPPEIDKIAQAIAKKYAIKIQPSGAFAANLLGLSQQVPAKIVYLTDGISKKINIGGRVLLFKKSAPSSMQNYNSISGLVIQAIRYLGKDSMSREIVNQIKKTLSEKDLARLSLDQHKAPVWVAKVIQEIVN